MLLSTFRLLTGRKRTNMNASIYIMAFASELINFFTPPFAFYTFCLQTFYSLCTCKVASSIIFPLITSFIHPITELHQIYSKQSLPKLTSCLRTSTSFQPGCVDRRHTREWRPFLSAEVPRRITLCLNSPACHDKKDEYRWLSFFHAALAEGEYFFAFTYK